MTEASARLALPLLQAGQAQKELYHNEALMRLDLAVGASAETIGDNSPPSSPDPGRCWIVGSAPTGAWAGQAGALAGWTSAGWRFVAPPDGTMVWLASDAVWVYRIAGDWVAGGLPVSSLTIGGVQVVGARQPAVADPAGGGTIDTEARAAVSALAGVLRAHGLIAP